MHLQRNRPLLAIREARQKKVVSQESNNTNNMKNNNPTITDSSIFIQPEVEPNIALRPDSDGKLDDVFVNDVKTFRIERMNNNTWWMACYLYSDEEIHFDLFPESDGFTLQVRNCPKSLVYEKGSIEKGIDD